MSCRHTSSVSLPAADVRTNRTESSLQAALTEAARAEAAKAVEVVGAEATARIFQEELAGCRQALSSRDIKKILIYAPGKELLPRIAPRLGCKDTAAAARAAFKHLSPTSFEDILSLRSELRRSLALAS